MLFIVLLICIGVFHALLLLVECQESHQVYKTTATWKLIVVCPLNLG